MMGGAFASGASEKNFRPPDEPESGKKLKVNCLTL